MLQKLLELRRKKEQASTLHGILLLTGLEDEINYYAEILAYPATRAAEKRSAF
jgi:hypothetical protein